MPTPEDQPRDETVSPQLTINPASEAIPDALEERAWAERARLDPKTVRRARDAAEQLGLIERVRRYGGSADDCDAWMPASKYAGIAGQGALWGDSPIGRYAPYPDSQGSANIERLRDCHATDRERWKTYLSSRWAQRPKLNTAGSRIAFTFGRQRGWLVPLRAAESSTLCAARMTQLGALPRSARGQWFSWLALIRSLAPGERGSLLSGFRIRPPHVEKEEL